MDMLEQSPFLQGLMLGVIAIALAWIAYIAARRPFYNRIHEENQNQKTTIYEMAQSFSSDLEKLKVENDHLKTKLVTLSAKPRVAELRDLEIMERSVRLMHEQYPDFAPIWQKARQQAEVQDNIIGTGAFAWVKRKLHSQSQEIHTTEDSLVKNRELLGYE